MLNNISPIDGTKSLSMHGSVSPENTRSGLVGRSRANHLQYPSPDNMSSPFSPGPAQSTTTFTGSTSSSTTEFGTYQQPNDFKRSNSDHSLPPGQGLLSRPPLINSNRSQRHSSFGIVDAKTPDAMFSRPSLQTTVGSYGLPTSSSGSQSYHSNQSSTPTQSSMHAPYVNQQNFAPFSLPPPGYATTAPTTSSRDNESSYAISPPQATVQMDYQQRDSGSGQQSGPDMMLLDQMTAPNTMPVFGGEGYSRSPFAIPDDFVAYLFSGQQFDNSSPMAQSGMGQQGYAK
jgi:hypothetical protein